jgi:hypothetical protein
MGACTTKESFKGKTTIKPKKSSSQDGSKLHIEKTFEFSSKEIEGNSTTVVDSSTKIEPPKGR